MYRNLLVKIVVFALTIGLCGALRAQTAEIIVETNVGGKNTQFYKEIKGTWFDSEAKSTAEGCTPNIKSRYIDEYHKGGTARFQPNIPVDGNYEISITWWRSGNCNKAKYIIHYDKEDKIVYATQDGWGGLGPSNANQWLSLGVYPLKAGTENYVDAGDEDNDGKPDRNNNGRLYCDAMRFALSKAPVGPPTASLLRATVPTEAATTPTTVQTQASATPGFVIPTATAESPTPAVPTPAITETAPAKLNWLTNVQEAQQMATQQGKGIFVYFYLDVAAECQRMDNETFVDAGVVKAITDKYIPLKFDMKTQPAQAYHLGAYRAPTIIMYKPDGTPFRRIIGFKSPSELLSLIQ